MWRKTAVNSKVVLQQTEWYFQSEVGGGIDKPFYVLVRFWQRGKLHNNEICKASFYKPLCTFAQGIFLIEKYPDAGIFWC